MTVITKWFAADISSDTDDETICEEVLRCVIPDVSMLPRYATEDAAGLDLYSAESRNLYPGKTVAVPTGLRVALPRDSVGFILPRSGLTKAGLVVHIGTLDEDYRGEISVQMSRLAAASVDKIEAGRRIAQLVVVPRLRVRVMRVDELEDTQRGMGGFGSTGDR